MKQGVEGGWACEGAKRGSMVDLLSGLGVG